MTVFLVLGWSVYKQFKIVAGYMVVNILRDRQIRVLLESVLKHFAKHDRIA